MKNTLQLLSSQGEMGLWICPDCVPKSKEGAKYYKIKIEVMSYYTEGECQRFSCAREEKYSPILQLLLVVGESVP